MPWYWNFCICFIISNNGYLNTFHATGLFLYPPGNIRKPDVFCFQGVWKEISDMKWVNIVLANNKAWEISNMYFRNPHQHPVTLEIDKERFIIPPRSSFIASDFINIHLLPSLGNYLFLRFFRVSIILKTKLPKADLEKFCFFSFLFNAPW